MGIFKYFLNNTIFYNDLGFDLMNSSLENFSYNFCCNNDLYDFKCQNSADMDGSNNYFNQIFYDNCQGWPEEDVNYFSCQDYEFNLGCTNSNACNYNNNATVNDGSCTIYCHGCKDILANNVKNHGLIQVTLTDIKELITEKNHIL